MGFDPDDTPATDTGNTPFRDIVDARITRRAVLGGSLATAAATLFAPGVAGAGKPPWANGPKPGKGPTGGAGLLGFDPIPLGGSMNTAEVSAGYTAQPLAVFGDPINPSSGPAYNGYATTAAEHGMQIGGGHDGMWYHPLGQDRGVLIMNNEYTTTAQLFASGTYDPTDPEHVAKSQACHGLTVVEIAKVGGTWTVVDSPYARRVTPKTPVTFSGPAASHPAIAGGPPALGTLGNCGNGYTPWGTYLTAEENFDTYFSWTGDAYTPDAAETELGVSTRTFDSWFSSDPRFDLGANPAEIKRFGWIVEVDPLAPGSEPIKRTALGRFKHEAAELVEGKGKRAVVYMGDDQVFEYVYKFVSAKNWKAMKAQGKSPLDEGTLYVAEFFDDGSGVWHALDTSNPALAGWSQADIVMNARGAANLVGATPMDRPEWIAAAPAPDGGIYVNCTNNDDRTVPNGPNPRTINEGGQIVRIDDHGKYTGTTFDWEIFLLAYDPTKADGATDDVTADNAFSSPDGLWIDPDGRIFIQTDGDQLGDANNQMVVATPQGEVKRLFNGPAGCEVTGFAWTPDYDTLFVNIQHPGDNGADPAVSTFPEGDGWDIPRHATVAITKTDGGVVGT